ncbi:MAG TPA: hydroxyacid dehydrogenase [Candidatus Bathyarchaeia archaeon]|nr:hydroxyacid dehydrogenase [Candidatus Bathyarchaeia archaeon]
MTGLRVLISDPIEEDGVKILVDEGFAVDNQPGIDKTKLASIIGNYDLLIVRGRTKVDSTLIDKASRLKIIGRAGVGLDNIDLQAAKTKGITVLNTPSAPTTSVAELTVGLMLSLLRKIPFADKSMKDGRWIKNQLMGEELQSKRIGIIGRAGRIGNEVSRILTVGFQAEVLGYDVIKPRGIPGLSYEIAESIEELLQNCDIVTVHIPYTPQTHYLLNEKRLKMMKKGSYLVNTSRGDIVEGPALLALLKEGYIAGAGLDVFHLEPPADQWEKDMINLPEGTTVVTCHIGAETRQAQKRASVEIAERVKTEALRVSATPNVN